MATYTLTGDITDVVGGITTFPSGDPPKAYLIPYGDAIVEGDDLRIGGIELTLDSAGSFSQGDLPGGGYAVAVNYFDPAVRRSAWWKSDYFELAANDDLSDLVTTEPYVPAPPGAITEGEVEDIAAEIAAALDEAALLRQAFGSRLGEPISPWEPEPTIEPEYWTIANMQSGGGYNASTLTPSLTANGTAQTLKTRINVGNMGSQDTTFRFEFDYNVAISGGWGDIQLLLTDSAGTAYAGTTAQMVVNNSSPKKTGHYIFDFLPKTTGGTYIELRLTLFNNAPSGTIGVTGVSLKRTAGLSRPMLVSQQFAGGTYPYVYWQQKDVKTDVWKLASIIWTSDGSLSQSYQGMGGFPGDSPWLHDPADPAFVRTTAATTVAVNTQQESGAGGSTSLRVNNNDQILSVWNGSAWELRGNTHGGEFMRAAGISYKADYGTGAGFVTWTLAHGLDPIRRFQVNMPTEMRRSVDGTTPFCNVDHLFTLFPDGVIRCDRTTTFLADTQVGDLFEWMSSHSTSDPYLGRLGKGTEVQGEIDNHAKLATPTTTAPATATVGGTLPAATYSYRVAALSTAGETLASAAVTQATTGTTSTVTVNWSAVSGAIGYVIYGRTAGRERLLARVGAVTTWVDDGSIIPDTVRSPQTVSSARSTGITLDVEGSGNATWAVLQEPTTGWCLGNIYDREAVLARTGVGTVRTRIESGSGIVKNYMNVHWTGGSLVGGQYARTIPSGTVWSATHWTFVYLPANPDDYHREIALRAGSLSTLADLYPTT